MNKSIKITNDSIKIIRLFLYWKLGLFLTLLTAVSFIPLAFNDRFLGGGPVTFHLSPSLFSWANFDGEHYLSIAIYGYKSLEQAFFPVFPFLISFFGKPFSDTIQTSLINYTIIGLLISNASFLLALFYLFELIKIDYSKKIAFLTIILLISFPTSFYFGALYNESLFLLLSVLAFSQSRKGNWFLASIFGFIASGTRVFGILLLPALLIEAYQSKEKSYKILWVFLIPLGLILYMAYQYFTIGDPLAFYHFQKNVGEQHQSGIILPPQVFYRYFKMLLTFEGFKPIYQTIILEFFIGTVFFVLPIYGYIKKVRTSYIVYSLLGFLLPTIQGSFSSLPRYVLVLFPSFIILSIWIDKLPSKVKIGFILCSMILLAIEAALFFRVYWVA